MASDVSICNGALIKLGRATITSLQDDSVEAKSCNNIFADTRDAVFREHPWNCLKQRRQLSEISTPPAFGYDHQYALPANPYCLRVLTLNDVSVVSLINGILVYDFTRIIFKLEGRNLLTDETEAKIVYVSRNTDPNTYDALLLEALKSRLAAELAWPLTKNAKLVSSLWEIYASKLSTARTVDGMEETPDQFQSDEIGGVRH